MKSFEYAAPPTLKEAAGLLSRRVSGRCSFGLSFRGVFFAAHAACDFLAAVELGAAAGDFLRRQQRNVGIVTLP